MIVAVVARVPAATDDDEAQAEAEVLCAILPVMARAVDDPRLRRILAGDPDVGALGC